MADLDGERIRGPHAGEVSGWCRGLLLSLAAVTVFIAMYVGKELHAQYACEHGSVGFWIQNGVGAVVVAYCAAVLTFDSPRMGRGGPSSFVWLAVTLPVLHVLGVLVFFGAWVGPFAHQTQFHPSPINAGIPLPSDLAIAIAIGAGVIGALGWCVKRRRGADEWIQTSLVFALSFLFVLGTWAPICCSLWMKGAQTLLDVYAQQKRPVPLLAAMLAPPLLVATVFTVLTTRWPAVLRRHTVGIAVAIVGVFIGALWAQWPAAGGRFDAEAGSLLYINMMQPLVIALGLAVVLLLVATTALWLRKRRRFASLCGLTPETGVIVDEPDAPDVIAELQITSWLRAPQLWSRAFTVRTATGDVPVDSADLLYRVPLSTTYRAVGERAPVLRVGDPVVIYRASDETHDAPFRSMSSTARIVVATPDAQGARLADIALLMWRPCVAYGAIALVIALPAALALCAG